MWDPVNAPVWGNYAAYTARSIVARSNRSDRHAVQSKKTNVDPLCRYGTHTRRDGFHTDMALAIGARDGPF